MPIAIYGSQKYGDKGLFDQATFQDYQLPADIERTLQRAGNNSLAQRTWGVYKTAENHLAKCAADTGNPMTPPLGRRDILLFVGWLLNTRKVRPTTVESYLSGLRTIHLVNGFDTQCLRPEIVKSIITGAKNITAIEDRACAKPRRVPVTLTLLKLLKIELNKLDKTPQFKKLTWAISCILFFGALRVHEILSREALSYDPNFTLLQENLKLKIVDVEGKDMQILQILLKSPKENRVGNKVVIDIYENGSCCCPVKAFNNWMSTLPPTQRGKPAFVLQNGQAYTGSLLNKTLKKCFEKHVPKELGFVSSHSFRSGVASMMGNLGWSDEDIKALGRWSSSAFETYIRLPRTKRASMARRLAGTVN